MNSSLLKEVVLEQRKVLESIDLGIKRQALGELAKYIRLPHSIVISGIRRSGKSTLLAQIIHNFYKDEGYYINFEDERLIEFSLADFNTLYEIFIELYGDKKTFFLDEIQNIPKWEIFVRRMQDRGYKFFITGSNASLLSKKLGSKLTGRYISLELYPFSFKEFLDFNDYSPGKDTFLITSERGRIKRYFSEYLKKGGMPEYLKYKDNTLLKRAYEDILYRDIVARYEIKEVKALRELGFYFLSNIGGLFSYNSIKKLLRLGSVNTVKSYADYLENSFLIFTIPRFSYSLKNQLASAKKAYCVDNGLIEAVAFQFSQNKGKFLENLVFIELKRRYREIYYYKTNNGLEIDFLIRKGKRNALLIQVTEGLGSDKVRRREVNALTSAMDELKIKDALILTEDNEEKIKVKDNTITVIPIYKWLLEKRLQKKLPVFK